METLHESWGQKQGVTSCEIRELSYITKGDDDVVMMMGELITNASISPGVKNAVHKIVVWGKHFVLCYLSATIPFELHLTKLIYLQETIVCACERAAACVCVHVFIYNYVTNQPTNFGVPEHEGPQRRVHTTNGPYSEPTESIP